MTLAYHQPVLLQESVDGLNIKQDGVYVDATFGGGGHARAILALLGDKGRLVAFDQDEAAQANLPDDPRIIFVKHNFRHLKRFLRLHGIAKVDGILADLGVSSHQFDEAERGFSYRFEAALDMRMDTDGSQKASTVLNGYSADELQRVFSHYGEVRNAKTLSQKILQARHQIPLRNTSDFLRVLDTCIMGKRQKYLAQVFQALRIEVNDELGALKELLQSSLEMLGEGGRLVVISYHSLEDGLVKSFMQKGNFEGDFQKDFFGNIYRPFKIITKKAIEPSQSEMNENSRAHSAKLRIAEKIMNNE